jgi:glycerol kinase
MGLTRGSTAGHIARATLEGIAMQVVDVVEALGRVDGTTIRVDGGACASDLLMQTQADLLGCAIERPRMLESTALGAAFLAGLATGVWSDLASVRALRQVDRRFEPLTTAEARRLARARWAMAVGRTRGWEERA